MVLVVLLSLSIHACYIGGKVVVSLYARELGASQAIVGVLASFYAVVPMLMGVYRGRLADKHGARLPLIIGAVGTALNLATISFLSRR